MPAKQQTEYCRVSSKTGEILEGPMALPQNWGNVSGFCHLQRKDLIKYNWYPVRDDGVVREDSDYTLLFLPEHGFVLRVPPDNKTYRGGPKYCIKQLYLLFGFFTTQPFYSDVLDITYKFPNTEHEQRHRQNCLLVGEDYVCMAETLSLEKVKVTVPCDKIKELVQNAVNSYNKQLENLFVGLEDIKSATDAELAAILDTNFADYYG